jgi:beta-glucanase (GH16 family)
VSAIATLLADEAWPPELTLAQFPAGEGKPSAVGALIVGEIDDPRGQSVDYVSESFSDEFHVFTVEWTPTTVRWLLDGEEQSSVEYTLESPLRLMLSANVVPCTAEVTTECATEPPATVGFEVDWIRTYTAAG